MAKTDNNLRAESETATSSRIKRCAILGAATQRYCISASMQLRLIRPRIRRCVNKIAIHRALRSRESRIRACIERASKYKLGRWIQAIEQESTPRQQNLTLFMELARRISSGDVTKHLPVRGMMCQTQAARDGFVTHRREMQALILRLATMLMAPNSSALADALILLWQGVALDLHANGETRRLASLVPALANQLTHVYARDAE